MSYASTWLSVYDQSPHNEQLPINYHHTPIRIVSNRKAACLALPLKRSYALILLSDMFACDKDW